MKVEQLTKMECEYYTIHIPHCVVTPEQGQPTTYVARSWFSTEKSYKDEVGKKKVLQGQALNLALYLAVVKVTAPWELEKTFGAGVNDVCCELVRAGIMEIKQFEKPEEPKEEPKEEKEECKE
jgi:hypothetical protein